MQQTLWSHGCRLLRHCAGLQRHQGHVCTGSTYWAVHSYVSVSSCSFALQVWNEAKADEEVLAMVVRTGLCTTMGTMLRQVMAPLNTLDLFRDPFVVVSLQHWLLQVRHSGALNHCLPLS